MKRFARKRQYEGGEIRDYYPSAENGRYHGLHSKSPYDDMAEAGDPMPTEADFPGSEIYSSPERSAYVDAKNAWTARLDAIRFEKRPIYACDKCDKPVVWAKSKRTGKMYLCDVRMDVRRWGSKYGKGTYAEFRFYESKPHFKTCGISDS